MSGVLEFATMAPFVLLIGLWGGVPNIDPGSICRSVRSNALPEEQANAFENCVNEERAAQQKVQSRWTKARPAAREACASIDGIPFSYVAVLTCLNMPARQRFRPCEGQLTIAQRVSPRSRNVRRWNGDRPQRAIAATWTLVE